MAKQQPIYSPSGEQQLMVELWDPRLADNLNEFVRFVYPWGKAGTPLEFIDGPRNWQDELLKDISAYIKSARTHHQIHKALPAMYKAAIASGRGIGKSATFAWLAHWLVTTRLGSSAWVMANGEPQLKTKTFPEISKWVQMAINSHWWEVDATKIYPADWLAESVERDLKINRKYWYIVAQLWSAENPDSSAGAHNGYGEMYLLDEASGIDEVIWPVIQGVFTEEIVDRYWLAFSNPRRPSGAFFECFHKNSIHKTPEGWRTWQIDSRTVNIPEDVWKAIVNEHGENSTQAKVEVYGQFPDQGQNQFISRRAVSDAMTREVFPDPGAPLIMGVDVARFGSDNSMIAFRKGRDAKSIPWFKANGIDTTQLAEKAAELALKYKPAAIFVDGGGVGGGVVDQLKSWGYRVIEVQSQESASDKDKYANKRCEMWGKMREWLQIGSLPRDLPRLEDDFCNLEYSYTLSNQIKLERKEELKKRGFASPDAADALALTFAQPVARTDETYSRNSLSRRNRVAKDMDYNLFGSTM